ncbi:TIGR03619 family F420-dependent LLM class oxidoreductase [Saccharopolyspora sp. K220]|uniref:TIGR03619 family F420-dependent LLM class oxidoreductase n=1 Tax=Saccharopolyspora soli TaxID=2926618 RepID=UPI001F581DA6|nr:TIGR03619 family F420-dependent LLM class oxidoreductase [Saccharopolyspora soli]MCI2423639.1 TIGR03619 family F420-dependent LLM class oxidoreductase [Saccharopolyspora soli]
MGGGKTIPEVFHSLLDPFALMSVAAAVTERPLIGANILNAPWYAPAVLARSLTTIDRLSGGRLLPGFGVGWSPEEYSAAGVPMNERGAGLDECLDVLDRLWSDNPAEYQGRHWTLPATYADVKPVQRPRPPLYLAGFAPAAMRRAARRADGWLPVYAPETGPFDPATVNEPMRQIRQLAADADRDPAALSMVMRVYPMTPSNTVDDVVSPILRAAEETDVDHFFVQMMNVAETVDHSLEFAEGVLSKARG